MKKEIIYILIAIALGFIAYKMGQSDSKTDLKEIWLQEVVDSVSVLSANANKKWQEIEENNAKSNKKLDEAINVISNFKPIVRYEIIQNSKQIDLLTDTTLALFIDSIRRSTGFHFVQ